MVGRTKYTELGLRIKGGESEAGPFLGDSQGGRLMVGETKKGPTACSSLLPLPYLIVPLFVLSSIKWYNHETPGRVWHIRLREYKITSVHKRGSPSYPLKIGVQSSKKARPGRQAEIFAEGRSDLHAHLLGTLSTCYLAISHLIPRQCTERRLRRTFLEFSLLSIAGLTGHHNQVVRSSVWVTTPSNAARHAAGKKHVVFSDVPACPSTKRVAPHIKAPGQGPQSSLGTGGPSLQ